MTKNLIFLFGFLSLNGFGQDEGLNIALDSACSCLTEALNRPEENTKFDFELKFDVCLDSLFDRAIRIDTAFNSNLKKNQLLNNDLKNNCENFDKIDSLHQLYMSHTFESIASKTACQIMKSGTFVTYGDKDSTLIIMDKKRQLVQFKSGTYTKSKVKWIDDCSYQLIRIESTDPFEKQVPPGNVRLIKIIYVGEDGTIFYEILVNGKAYPGRLIKIAE
jgi:hypothetical protein